MTSPAPALSILLMCWNHKPFIAQCVQSLRDQTSKDFEVIFLDNLSTDGSFELASRLLGELDVPVTLIQNDRPQRVAANNNRLFAASSGALVATASSDDWYAPAYVERMIAAAAGNPGAGMLTPLGWYYYEEEQRLELVDGSRFCDGDVHLSFMRHAQPFFMLGHCFRRSVVEEVGGWDEDQLIEDQDFLARVTRRTRIHQVREPLVYYRKHTGSASFDLVAMRRGCEAFYAKHRGDSGFDMRGWMAERYRAIAAVHLDRGERREAAALLGRALRIKPLYPATYRTAAYLARRLWRRS